MKPRLIIPEVTEGEFIPANPGGYVRKPSLGTARGIRRELAQTYLEFRRGQIDAEQTKTATFVLRTLLEAVKLDEIERRLIELEQMSQ
ncbi:MAG: hypothetical protein PHV02_16015 [Rhodocyclaceae bacterium]|nr:hypothetical protein [Rhodocyclaceae bacterium]